MSITTLWRQLATFAVAALSLPVHALPECAKTSAYALPASFDTLLVSVSDSGLNRRARFEHELATVLCASPSSRKTNESLLVLMTVAEGMGTITEAIRALHGRIASDTNLNFEATLQNIATYKYSPKAIPTKELKEQNPGEVLVRGYITRTSIGDASAYPTRPILTVYYGKKGDAHALVLASPERVEDEAAFESWRARALSIAKDIAASVSEANKK